MASLLFACWILLQTPAVQTFVAKEVLESLNVTLNGRIKFSKIHIKPFTALVLKDVALIDTEPPTDRDGESVDTVANAKTIVVTFSLKGLRRDGAIHIKRLSVSDGSFSLAKDERGSNISRFFNKSGVNKKNKSTDLKINADRINVSDFRFRLLNLGSDIPPREYGIDWKNLDVTARVVRIHDLTFGGGRVSCDVKDISAIERSGYDILTMSGKATLEKGRTSVHDLSIQDKWSDIRMTEYSMEYSDATSFSNYIDEVVMTGLIHDSKVDFKSLSYFAPSLRRMKSTVCLKMAEVRGPVKDLTIKSFDFTEKNSDVSGLIDGRLSGLPSAKKMKMGFSLTGLKFTTGGIGTFIKGLAPLSKIDISRFAAGTKLVFNGKVKGTLNSLDVQGNVASSIGSVSADLKLRDLLAKGKAIGVGGNVATRNLDVGRLAGVRQIGDVTLRGALDATLGKDKTSLRIDSLSVDRIYALGYTYTGIAAAGTYSENAFDGRIVCSDPNLNFLFQGLFTLSAKTRNGLYKFYASIGYADLHALRLDRRENSKISGRVNANYMRVGSGDVIGDLDIMGLTLENDKGWHEIGDICVKSHSSGDVSRVNITSSFVSGSYIGSKPFTSMVKDVQGLTVQRELPSLYNRRISQWDGDEYDLALDVSDAQDILSFLKPGLYIAKGSKARLNITREGDVAVSVKSRRVALGRNFLKDIDLALDNKDSSLNASITCSAISVSGLDVLQDTLSFHARNDSFGAGFSYDNGSDPADKGKVLLSGKIGRGTNGELTVNAKTHPSSIWYDDAEWNVSESAIGIVGKNIKIDNLTARCQDQSINVNGGYSSTINDTLSIKMVKFDLGLLNKFLGEKYGISGLATGHAIIASPWKTNPGLMMNLASDSTEVARQRMGTLRLAGSLDDGKMRVIAKNDIDGKRTLNINGDYFPEDKRIDATADFNGFNIGYLAPALESVFSGMEGSMSGTVQVKGPLDTLSLSSKGTRFDDVLLKVGFTNVPYFVNGPFSITDSGMFFDGLTVKDRFDGTGTISGGLLFGHFKDFRMDTRITMREMEAIDMAEDGNQTFYGHLFASGDVSVKGPFEAIQLDVNVRTEKNGRVHIPIDNASNDGKNDLLTFKQVLNEANEDPYEMMIRDMKSVRGKGSDFGLKLRVSANQGTEAYVEIDRTAGNVLSGRGQGTIDIEVRPGRDLFTINGDYTIRSGNFHFNAMDIAKRDFIISDGSSIRFNGDIMDSDLDIKGIYTTKASVATLIADTSAVSARRTVNCGIGVSGKFREPKLSFSIEVPDLDPTTKSRVESALNTEDKVQRQFLSLLISGSFMPDEQSGVVNNTNVLYSNVAEIMAGQLNSILQKLDIPLDFGLNYQSSDSGSNIFDVAVSTQLFNNRVIVNGNVGNREYANSSTSEGDVVGNLDIEIKLGKSGQLRLNLFSHSADDYTNYLDNTQRNGVGIAYQREFNTFMDFFRNLFSTRKKRERKAAATENNARAVKRVVISPGETNEKQSTLKEYDN